MNFKTQEVPHVNVEVSENDIQNGALQILKVIRPNWEESSITFKLLTDGITNKLVGCKPEEADDEEIVLVRIYGNKTDLIIDRKAETRNIILLHKAGLAPNLYATFKNGLAYRYLPGCTLTSESVREPTIYTLVAKQLALLHRVNPNNGPSKTFLWDKIRQFLDLIPDTFSDPEKHKRYVKNVIPKSKIEEEMYKMKEVIENLDSPIVFAHNDLLLGNVIYNKEKNKVTFIDYEYAALNYQSVDIANHFAEFVGIDEIDYSLYPNKDFQTKWIKVYLKEYNGQEPSSKEIEKMYVQINKSSLVTHIFWGVWSLVQAEHSSISFDYMGYAAIRFKEYFSKKDLFLSLELPS
ncbi:ethanolamine kinase [Diabrotica undecimpunctata]|uniref:ethanolamine kinase n=1 Tax=Diabrotica undecimpunctata TaxID=50387 RepID=UPI003B64091B